ncbi:MAG TPA: multidrug transporter [Candidatus Moranbacteria bacterium]|jgi:hypothetical protein|nr:multidrug transporter [Candidatus Moranbacteria bacterium]HQB59532.1 multidrug transporter [Candidatus Moranbacteria bacterium]
MAKEKTKIIYRKSDNGRLTTKEYAKKHPNTTEKEIVKVPKKHK